MSESSGGRLWRWLLLLALAGFAAVAFYGRQRGIHWGGDDADYVLLAKALGQFRYHDLFLVGTPPHTTYPPVYPAILALWGLVVGYEPAALSTVNVLLAVGTLAIMAHLVAAHTSIRHAAIAVILVGSNPFLLEYSGRLMSESPTMFFGAACIWLAHRSSGRAGVALAIVAAVLCALTRTAGVAAVVGLGAHWLWRRKYVPAVALGVTSLLCLGAWFLWTIQEAAPANTGYAARFVAYTQPDVPLWRSLATIFVEKVATVLGSQLPEALGIPLQPGWWDNLAWAPLSVGAVGIGVWTIGRRLPVLGLVLVAYTLVLITWPFSEARLLVPILPALVLAAPVGAGRLARFIHKPAGRPVEVAVATLLIALGVRGAPAGALCDGSIYSRAPECTRDSEQGLGRAIAHVEEHVPDDAVVMVLRGEITHFYTGNLTVPWPDFAQARNVHPDTLLARAGADYIIATKAFDVRLTPLSIFLEKACERLGVAYLEPPHTLVLEVRPAGAAASGEEFGNACEEIRRHFAPALTRP